MSLGGRIKMPFFSRKRTKRSFSIRETLFFKSGEEVPHWVERPINARATFAHDCYVDVLDDCDFASFRIRPAIDCLISEQKLDGPEAPSVQGCGKGVWIQGVGTKHPIKED